jgi:hypothetical protein
MMTNENAENDRRKNCQKWKFIITQKCRKWKLIITQKCRKSCPIFRIK